MKRAQADPQERGHSQAALCLLTLCLTIGLGACTAPSPPIAAAAALYERDVSNGLYDITPLRGERGPLRLHRDGDEYLCSDCHEGFTGGAGEDALKGEHSDIVFDHGRNLLCLNCHHPKNSDVFLDYGDKEIPPDQPTLLCAKCHGPHYREWNHDVHGRVNLYWDAKYGQQKKLDCIQCHDPHRPRFPSMTPEPPPLLTRFEHDMKGTHSHP